MKLRVLLTGGLVALLVGCGNPTGTPRGGTGSASGAGGGGSISRLNGAGSSFVNPIMTKWASLYQKEKGLEVNYQSTGSGNGVQQMIKKTVDFGCTDAPMNDAQMKEAASAGGDVIHIPLVMGGVVPVYNLPGIEEPLKFTGQALADIFLGNIKKWNDPALQQLNQGIQLPDRQILVVYRSDPSGTTFNFVEFLSKTSKDWKLGVKTSVDWPTGEGAKGSEGVAGKLSQAEGTIGYVELLYALQKKTKYGHVQNKAGKFVRANLESVSAAASNSQSNISDDLRYSLIDAPGDDSYPITATTWAVLYTKQPKDKGIELVKFLRWVTHEGQENCKDLQYARLSSGLVERIDQKLNQVKSGE
jgi:phosphate transport system substrate-binding protein